MPKGAGSRVSMRDRLVRLGILDRDDPTFDGPTTVLPVDLVADTRALVGYPRGPVYMMWGTVGTTAPQRPCLAFNVTNAGGITLHDCQIRVTTGNILASPTLTPVANRNLPVLGGGAGFFRVGHDADTDAIKSVNVTNEGGLARVDGPGSGPFTRILAYQTLDVSAAHGRFTFQTFTASQRGSVIGDSGFTGRFFANGFTIEFSTTGNEIMRFMLLFSEHRAPKASSET